MRISTRFFFHIMIIVTIFYGCAASDGGSGSGSAPKADHTTLDVSSIPSSYLDAARVLKMTLDHASVGYNIKDGMNSLVTADPTRYSYPNWDWYFEDNPGWQTKIDDFAARVADYNSSYDVFQMKFCYIDQDADFANYRDMMLTLEAAYPSKTFIWWTMPIKTSGTDNSLRETFNNKVRTYCAANNKPLFDIADIESHDASGNAFTSSGYEAMASEWSSDGGHLSTDGKLRVAKAMWYLMAEIAGWNR